jgi:predicted GNAT family N-acyltransferase
MITIKKYTSSNIELAEKAFEIRRKVFVEEQKVPADEEFDEFENSSTHFLAFYNDIPAATARWRFTEKGIKLERFAVLKEFRNKKIGSEILNAVLDDVKPFNKYTYLHAQLAAVNFYERAGFKKKGDIFSECDIEHYLMVLLSC